jgi:hypothetical protein
LISRSLREAENKGRRSFTKVILSGQKEGGSRIPSWSGRKLFFAKISFQQ